MNSSIEQIWKEGFLKESSMIVPNINDLYNQKSIHLVDKVRRMFNVSLNTVVITAILFPFMYYFLGLGFMWQGLATSALLLLSAWYAKTQMRGLDTIDQGTTSFDYLKSLDKWLKNALAKSEIIARLSYPLYLLIAISTIWSTWEKQVGEVPLTGKTLAGVLMVLMIVFSSKIYRWEMRMMYGRVIDKLHETIAEMEKLTKPHN